MDRTAVIVVLSVAGLALEIAGGVVALWRPRWVMPLRRTWGRLDARLRRWLGRPPRQHVKAGVGMAGASAGGSRAVGTLGPAATLDERVGLIEKQMDEVFDAIARAQAATGAQVRKEVQSVREEIAQADATRAEEFRIDRRRAVIAATLIGAGAMLSALANVAGAGS